MQAKILKKVNANAERARDGLQKRNSDLADLLGKYRSNGKIWKDLFLILFLIGVITANIKVM
jgi:hypothetical protein